METEETGSPSLMETEETGSPSLMETEETGSPSLMETEEEGKKIEIGEPKAFGGKRRQKKMSKRKYPRK